MEEHLSVSTAERTIDPQAAAAAINKKILADLSSSYKDVNHFLLFQSCKMHHSH